MQYMYISVFSRIDTIIILQNIRKVTTNNTLANNNGLTTLTKNCIHFRCLPRYFFRNSFINTVELQWLEHLWNHETMFETGPCSRQGELMSVYHSARSGGIIG